MSENFFKDGLPELLRATTNLSEEAKKHIGPSLKDPEHWQVDAALEAIEWANYQQELALWREQQRERMRKPGYFKSHWRALLFFVLCGVAFGALFMYVLNSLKFGE